ncbi:sigma-70 family RNA polymerase sigma factor [Brenneria izbisi]|uniref:Sigma-70 family RNA polymerase sigma factor n=1 Tax=Brenneria izbisi TaxID=2939450 RepID=A0AA42C0Y9_9GAMM|nr:sigma-70 family RNA polymerase sigma factor [Brenneria izbisi]MCV9877642.1 sigma-70 family RNA polymerase sigma factor [Brenneria izbisi]MCV9880793.1 sigma-70 family RNA polymerase sigma factor [Brenneria izbisi]
MGYTEKNLNTYLAHRAEFVDYATTIIGDRSHGEDVVQEAFIRLKSTAADRPFDEPVGYFRRMIRNLAIDWIRRARVEKRRFDTDADMETVAEEQPSLEEIIAHRRELGIIMEAIAELPERTRIALEMHRFNGCKLKEIAAHLNISVTLAHSLIYEGLAHCRRRLAEKTAS